MDMGEVSKRCGPTATESVSDTSGTRGYVGRTKSRKLRVLQ